MENIKKAEVEMSSTSIELLQSEAHLWNHIFNFINSMSLKCAVQLNIPDIIHTHARPMTLSSLVQALAMSTESSGNIYRLMRILMHSGFFKLSKDEESEEDGYLLTPACQILLKDKAGSKRPYLLSMLDPVLTDPWHCMSQSLRNMDENAFKTRYGMNFWEYVSKNEMDSQLFNDGMAADAAIVGKILVKECGGIFEGLRSVVDVGGGTGILAKTIAGAFPDIQCIVLDLSHVVAGLEDDKNLKFIGGDMFDSIPNADAILLKWILHDWNDDECIRILKICKEAIPSKDNGGKVIIIDMVVDIDSPNKESVETQLLYDMVLMALTTGKERNEKEWKNLFLSAGFSSYTITPLGVRSVIELYP